MSSIAQDTKILPYSFNRSPIYMRPDSHTHLPNNCLRPFSFLPLIFLFGDVVFYEYFCTITVFSLYGEHVVCFFLPDGVVYFVTTGWIFYTSLCDNSINQSTT